MKASLCSFECQRTENGCGRQHSKYVLAEGSDPAPYDLAEAGRDAFGHHHRRAALPTLARPSLPTQVHPMTDELRGIEWISCCLLPQSPGDATWFRIGRRACGCDDELRQLGLVEARQLEVTDLATL
jgi:hypothetical protein